MNPHSGLPELGRITCTFALHIVLPFYQHFTSQNGTSNLITVQYMSGYLTADLDVLAGALTRQAH